MTDPDAIVAGGITAFWGLVLIVMGMCLVAAFPKRGWGLKRAGWAGMALTAFGFGVMLVGLKVMGGT